jgi:hypothetical protein
MADNKKKRRKLLGFWDAQDRLLRLNSMYRLSAFGSANPRMESNARRIHDELDEVSTPEPDEELTDSELSDYERRQAIARERWRREGRS